MPKETQKTKKQHYVPRCYLEAWAIPNKYQVYVFDTKVGKPRISSINDIASENYFYDVVPNKIFSQQILKTLHERGILLDGSLPSQGIEHVFADYVEGPFSEMLKELKNKCISATPWIINNCYFISEQQKVNMSEFLALQYARTKQVRNNLLESANCLKQVLRDMGASAETIEEYSVHKEDAKHIQGQMLMDFNHLSEIAKSFFDLTWIFGINKTKKKLYTSDNPIGTHAHINHPIMSMNGLQSKGVEVFFPISPDCILIMFDGLYHAHNAHLNRRYVIINDEENIDYYNSLCALHSERCIFSTDGNYKLINEIRQKDPNVFLRPSTELSYGGKIYHTND